METPELADIDNDGDLDLFLAGAYAHLYFFENMGAGSNPQFVQRYDTLYFYVMRGVASASFGNSVDIDGDGDDDLAAGSSLLLNNSFGDQIAFSRVDRALPFVQGSFADLDADGDYDYIIPGGAYAIGYYENIGDSSWPVWDARRNLFPPDSIIRNIWSVTSGDLDGDNDQDLLVGHSRSSRPAFYRNIDSPESYYFVYRGDLYLPQWESHGASDLLLGDIDNDGDLDLLSGDIRLEHIDPLRLVFYRNDGTPKTPSWTYVTDDFQNVVSDHRNSSISPCLADVDKDGDMDLVMTNNGLGFQLFLNPLDTTDVEDYPDPTDVEDYPDPEILPQTMEISCYPNPANSSIAFTVNIRRDSYLDISIYNMLGQSIKGLFAGKAVAGRHELAWNAENNSSGIYFIRVSTGNKSYFNKFTILK